MTHSPRALALGVALALLRASGPAAAQSGTADLDAAVERRDAGGAVRLARERAAAEAAANGDRLALAARLETLAERVGKLPGAVVSAFVEEQLVRSLELQEEAQGRGRIEHLPTLEKLSDLYFTAGRWDRAEATDRRCLEIKMASLGPRDPGVAETQRNLSLSLFNQGKVRAAEELLRSSVATLEGAPAVPPLWLAYAVSDLADNLRAQSRYGEATPLFERSVRLAEQALGPSSPELVTLLINLGGLYRDTNRYGESAWRLGQALQIAQASSEVTPSERVSLWNNLAELHRLQGGSAEAERLYELAIEAAREALGEDHPKVATYQNQLGELLSEEGRHPEAEALYHAALALRVRVLGADHLDVAYTHKCLGQLFTRQGRLPEAEASLRRALAIQESRVGPRHPEVGTTLLALAEALERSPARAADALSLADRALAIFEKTPAERRAEAAVHALRATLMRRRGEREPARAELARALAILETLRPEVGGGEHTRAQSFARFLGEFQRMVAWQVEAGDVARAFDYAERARGRALLDQLAAAGVDLRSGIEPAERRRLEAREADVQSRLAEYRERLRIGPSAGGTPGPPEDLTQELAAAAGEFQAVYEQIKNASRFWRTRGAGGATIGLEALQKELIAPGRRLLFYVIGDEGSFVFDVPPTGGRPAVHHLVVPADAADALGIDAGPLDARRLRLALATEEGSGGILAQLSAPPPRSRRRLRLENALHALWRVLVPAPVWSNLQHCREVILVPDGLLHQLPFEVLALAPGAPDTPSRYWLDEGPPIRYAASATALAHLSRTRAPDGASARFKVVSVSDPVFSESSPGGRRLERLPGTARESEAIRAAFPATGPAAEVVVLQREKAREATVRAALPGARYIHLATHGLVDETQGDLFATLALTPPPGRGDSTDDGQLQLYEIYGLALRSELAVLSACESRVGRVVAGEGVFALSRAFLAAGARRTVASLWPAEDDSTAAIVSDVFQAVARAEARGRRPDFTAALTQAKRAARARPAWSDPFFWGPFVLEGVR